MAVISWKTLATCTKFGSFGTLLTFDPLHITLRPRTMDAIFQTTFSNAFSSMKMYEFLLKFHWSLFLGVQLTICIAYPCMQCHGACISQKRKGCQDDSPGVVWKRWRLPSKSHLKTRAVNLATFPFQYMVWVQLVALSFFSPRKRVQIFHPTNQFDVQCMKDHFIFNR